MTEPTPAPRSDNSTPAASTPAASTPAASTQAEPVQAQSVQAQSVQAQSVQAELARLDALATADHLDVYHQIADDLAARLAAPDADLPPDAASEPDRRPNG